MAERKIFVPEFDPETKVAVVDFESEGGLTFKPVLFYGDYVEETDTDQIPQPKPPASEN